MNSLAISGLLIFITSTCLGFFVLSRNPKSAQNRSYFYFNATITLYSFGYWLWQMSKTGTEALFWMKVLSFGVIFVIPTYLHFIFAFLDIFEARRREISLYYLISIIFAYCVVASLLFDKVVPRHNMGFWPAMKPLCNFYIAFWFWQVIYGFSWLIRGWRMTTGIKREQVKYFTLAALIAFASGSTNWAMWYDIPIYPLTAAIVLYVITMAYALVRYRFLNIATLTAKGIFAVSYAAILSTPFLIGYLTGSWFLGTAVAVVAGAAGPLAYRWLVTKAENRLLSEQKQYQQMLKNIARQMLRYHDTQRLIYHIVNSCVNNVRLSGAYIFLLNKNTGRFELAASEQKAKAPVIQDLEKSHPILQALRDNSDRLNLEALMLEYGQSASDGSIDQIRHFTKSLGASLLFAIHGQDEITGLLALGPKLNGSIYTQEDIEVFSLLATQSALALENCQYLEEIKGLYEKAVTDKLTGCYNRMFYEEYLQKSVEDAHQDGSALRLIMVDLNHFKHLNDTYGHCAGDAALKMMGATLKKCVRKNDVVVRYGGDEFSIFLKDADNAECGAIIKRLMDELNANPVNVKLEDNEASIKTSFSAGIASLKKEQTAQQLVQAADAALFQAKHLGIPYLFSD